MLLFVFWWRWCLVVSFRLLDFSGLTVFIWVYCIAVHSLMFRFVIVCLVVSVSCALSFWGGWMV